MNKRKKYKFKKTNPPFGWPLILFVVIFVEFVFLIQERAWSQNYVVVIDKFRDQAENLSKENQKLFTNISKFYDIVFKTDIDYLVKAPKEFFNNKKVSFLKDIKKQNEN